MKKTMMAVMVGLFLVGGVGVAQATVLVPGATYVNTSAMAPVYGTLVETTGFQAFSSTFNGTTISGLAKSSVYSNTTGLLFEYQVQMDNYSNTKGFGSLSAYDFDAFTVDAGYDPAKNLSALHFPAEAKDDFGIVYANYSHALNAGEGATLYLQTDAKVHQAGAFSLLGWGTVDLKGYQPLVTPEPGTVSLLGMGLLGLLGFRRKKSA